MNRRNLIRAIAACLALGALTAAAQGTFPVRPVRLICPNPVGSGSDVMSRTLAQGLTETYRQQVIVDNRPGAGSLIGSGLIAAAPADGYTIGVASTSTIVAPLLQSKPPYRPLEDFTQVALLASIASVFVIAPNVPAKTIQEFIAWAKARPGQLNFASIGAGSAAHLTPEIFNRAAGIQAVHVPFKSVADVYTEMIASRVHYLSWISPSSLPMLREGKLRAIAVTSRKRYPGLPDVPTLAESGVQNADVETTVGIVAPAGLPKAMVSRLHADIVAVLKRPDTKTAFERQGGEPAVETTPASYAALWKSEHELYRRLLPEIGLKAQ